MTGADRLRWRARVPPPPDLLAELRRLKPELIALLRAEAVNHPLDRRPRALLEEARATSGVTITDEEKALASYQAVARMAAHGADEEREALQGEERGRVVDLAAHRRTVELLLRAASPVATLPGAVRCRHCGAGIWVSPSWPGPTPTLCRDCEREGQR